MLPIIFFVLTKILFVSCFETVVIHGNFSQNYTITLNQSVEYIFLFNDTDAIVPSRVSVWTSDEYVNRVHPILVVARQQKEVLSWQVPLLVDTRAGNMEFYNTSRTLCPSNVDIFSKKPEYELLHWRRYLKDLNFSLRQSDTVISLASSSPVNVDAILYVEREFNFFINHSTVYNVTISPSKPKYFYYKFDENVTKAVILEVNSEDDICMFVSIQNSSCPVYDLEHDIRFEGYWETVNKKGGITLPKLKFPNGFFVLFVSKSEDYDCTEKADRITSRTKKISFKLTPSISYDEYMNAVFFTIGAIGSFYVIFVIMLYFCSRGVYKPMTMDYIDQGLGTPSVSVPQTPATTEDILSPDCPDYPDIDDNSSMDETEYDTITEAQSERHIYRTKSTLCLHDLARKDPRILNKKSYLYLWQILMVAIFYGLPVVQLVITYQRVLRETGNQDLCYYNFLCSHPLGLLSDFNHVFSNVGYVFLGILFLCLTYRRERMHNDSMFDKNFGIPQHYGMFYAMGIALIMEGILSGSYHVCPNHSNFQFDTSFMYVMAVLIMVKLYQNRHPDINATAYATFGVLAVIIFLGMVGILNGSFYFWIFFTVLHITTCLLLTIQIYYLGCWKLDRGIFKRIYQQIKTDFQSGPLNVLRPVYKGRMILLIIANVVNWVLAVFGLRNHERDFDTYLLAILMTNTTIYTLFYIIMKLCHKEKIKLQAGMFILLTFLTWGAAMYFFIHKSISWALTPAESRHYNQPCMIFHFYDPHDIWHFLSASAMFFSFMILLTIDDDLTHKRRTEIPVF